MTTASTQFTIVANTVSQADLNPNPSINTGGAGFNYPTFVPVQVPAAIPSKEARITNVSMPSIVLPNATFNIIVTFQTFIAPATKYTVHLTIPQLSLDHTSTPVTLSNLARGSTIFTITLPIQGHEGAEHASGIVTGQLDLLNEKLETDDGTPISFRVQSPGEERESHDHHDNSVPPILIPPAVGDQDASGGTVIILANPPPPSVAPDLDIDVHGFEPFEDVDLDLLIPMVGKSDHEPKKADRDGHFSHHFHFNKPNINALIANIKVRGRHSNKQHSKNVEI